MPHRSGRTATLAPDFAEGSSVPVQTFDYFRLLEGRCGEVRALCANRGLPHSRSESSAFPAGVLVFGGADHRFSWSVWVGLRPAKSHEKLGKRSFELEWWVTRTCPPATNHCPPATERFFDLPPSAARQTTQTDRLPPKVLLKRTVLLLGRPQMPADKTKQHRASPK